MQTNKVKLNKQKTNGNKMSTEPQTDKHAFQYFTTLIGNNKTSTYVSMLSYLRKK